MGKTGRVSILLSMWLFTSFVAYPQATPAKKYQSLLWEITGNGLSRPSYLYGTMHLSDKLVFNLPDSFFTALNRCEAVALELDMGQWMDDLMKMQEAERMQATGYASRNSGFYSSAFALSAPRQQDLKAILQFNPSLSNKLLYRTNRYNSDYEEDNYLDIFIYQAGKKLNKKIIGLEEFKRNEEINLAQWREEKFGEEDDEELREQNRLRLKAIKGENTSESPIETAYRKGDLDMLDSISKLSQSKSFLKYIVDERNFIMADRMDSVMRATPLFTGVGAAHLPGENGIIELLRKKGYRVRPVNPAGFDIKTKNTIDETRYPVKFSVQYPPDSVFSVALPGKMYKIQEGYRRGYYLHNDMSNGSYYCIQRVMHYGKLVGQTPDYILQRIDSLVFENIPGKLLSKKIIRSQNGFPGIEIVNKNSKGNVQRHQIFVTPYEIIAFKMHGIQEYVKKGTEADQFFSSIKFHEPLPGAGQFRSAWGFELEIKGQRHVSSVASMSNSPVQHEVVQGFDPADSNYTLIMAASLYDFEYIEEDTFELNMLAERVGLDAGMKLENRELTIRNGLPLIRFTLHPDSGQGRVFRGEIIISGPDYYLLCTSGDSLVARRLFDSFRVVPKQYTIPFIPVQDTTLHFTANAQEAASDYTSLIKERISLARKSRTKKDEKEKEAFRPRRESIAYRSPDTREKVFVEFRKFSMYYQDESMKHFWESRTEDLADDGKLKVSRARSFTRGSLPGYSLLLTDTGSSRGIEVQMLLRCGTLYTLKCVVDTVRGAEGFARYFMDSFMPADTCIGVDVLSNKLDDYFFSKLYSPDTTECKRAKAACGYVQGNILPVNFASLVRAVNHTEFDQLAPEEKRNLIGCFEKMAPGKSLPELSALYTRLTDSVDIQLAILRTIVSMKTAEATRTFMKLLKTDIPVTTGDYAISNVFTRFNDSLELVRELFPEIIRYTKYPEYAGPVYGLLSRALEAGCIKPKMYEKMLDNILLDANYELKKFISDRDRDGKPYQYSYSYGKEDILSILNTRQQKLYSYICLLAPFYRQAEVRRFFDKMTASSRSDRFKAVIYGKLLACDAALPDTVSDCFSSSVQGRIIFYRVLSQHDQLRKFGKQFMDQEQLVVSLTFGAREDFHKDTMVLMGRHRVYYNNKEGNVWVFKVKPKDKMIWKLCYSGVHPSDSLSVNVNPRFTRNNIAFETEEQLKKETEKLLKGIRIASRERATLKDFDLTETSSYSYFSDLFD